jgi:hypothetical protein
MLDTYASERIPHVRAVIDFSMALGRVICVPDPAECAARDASLIAAAKEGPALIPPPLGISPGVTLDGDPHAGRLFVQGLVAHGGQTGLFDDVVGRGWTLVGRSADPVAFLAPETAAFFTSVGGIGAHVSPTGPVRDLDGVYGRWFEEAGVEVVLQRPDFYVFGTAARPEGATDPVEQLRTSLGAASGPACA